ncbi:hypothetical protein COP2_043495 [Malus domestica]
METNNAKFVEEGSICTSARPTSEFEETISPSLLDLPNDTVDVTEIPQPLLLQSDTHNFQEAETVLPDHNDENVMPLTENTMVSPSIVINEAADVFVLVPNEVQQDAQHIRRSQRTRKANISSDFVYLNEAEHNVGDDNDPISFNQAVSSARSKLWYAAMEEELHSMHKNDVWTLVPNDQQVTKVIGCKWVYKTKRDSHGQVDKHKARLVAKGFTQREGFDYNETLSPVSTKDSMRVLLALTAHFDLELHQMDVKTAFLNGDLEEDIYMAPRKKISVISEISVVRKHRNIDGNIGIISISIKITWKPRKL